MIRRKLLTFLALIGFMGASFALAPAASAVNVIDKSCQGSGGNAVCQSSGDDLLPLIENVINTLLFIIGIIAVIYIIIGGFRYVTSNGDPNAATSGKNTIMYAAIGLVVAISAFAIVTFVLDRV